MATDDGGNDADADVRAARDARHARRFGPRPVAEVPAPFVLQPAAGVGGRLLEIRR